MNMHVLLIIGHFDLKMKLMSPAVCNFNNIKQQ